MIYAAPEIQICTVRATVAGAWLLTGWSGSRLLTRTYYGYTRADAVRLFRAALLEALK